MLTGAAYTIVRILQKYPTIRLAPRELSEDTGTEKQRMTLVISPANGCMVELDIAGL